MTAPGDCPGPRLLRELRRRTGVSQQFLSDVSGVSIRTIRGLESGTVARPRESSLAALADGLRLRDDQAEQLRSGWDRPARIDSLPELTSVSEVEQFLDRHGIGTLPDLATIHLTCQIQVAANRRISSVESVWVVRALRPGAQEFVYVDRSDPSMEVSDMIIDELRGSTMRIRKAERPDGEAATVVAFSLLFPAPLEVDQAHVFGFRVGVDPAYADTSSRGRALAESTGLTHGWRDPVGTLAMKVTFARAPLTVFPVTGPDRHRAGPDLVLDAANSTLLVREELPAGNHGLGWTWPAADS